jgi:hypothetical protein
LLADPPSPQDLVCSRQIVAMLEHEVVRWQAEVDKSPESRGGSDYALRVHHECIGRLHVAQDALKAAREILARHTTPSRRFVVVEVTDQVDGIMEHGNEDRSFQRDLFGLFCDAYTTQHPRPAEVPK